MIPHPNIDPTLLKLGPLQVRWYGLMYFLGYVIGFFLFKYRRKQGVFPVSERAIENLPIYLMLGMLIGARIFYVFIYNFDYYQIHPGEIFSVWNGGLSFHGAAVGMTAACFLFARRYNAPFYSVSDTLAYAAGPGYFLGRMGNFINQELYGRATDAPWGVLFPSDPSRLPRHPSQIYQAVLEGLLLFLFLHFYQRIMVKSGRFKHGMIGAWYLILFGFFRFCVEFAREPDAQLGYYFGWMTMGQILCVIMSLIGVGVLLHVRKSQESFDPKKSELIVDG